MFADVNATSPVLADIGNNIFWENHDLTPSRNGAAIVASTPNKLVVQGNLFSGNGPSDSSPADDTINVGGGFNPAVLGPTPDQFGNFTGNPAFVAPFDPRPGADGPGEFFQDAEFRPDLGLGGDRRGASLASLRRSISSTARGSGFPAVASPAPARPTSAPSSSTAPGASRSVVRSASRPPRSPPAAPHSPAGGPVTAQQLGNAITVDFSGVVDPSSVNPTDLVISRQRCQLGEPGARDQPHLDRRTHRRVHALGELQQLGDRQRLHPRWLDPERRSSGVGRLHRLGPDRQRRYRRRPRRRRSTPSSSPTPTPSTTLTPAPAAAPTAGHKKAKHAKVHEVTHKHIKVKHPQQASEKHKKHHKG